ncbi:acyl-CoA oxidase [Lactarius psammicola]|nr:acyl-CoA oxidase [Lactarius psammicola]
MSLKRWQSYGPCIMIPTLHPDYGLFTMLAAQINLTVGAHSLFLPSRPDLFPLVNSLKGDIIGLFLLSERGHGLNAINIETTAHQQYDGSYALHTPHEEATNAREPFPGIISICLAPSQWCFSSRFLDAVHFNKVKLPLTALLGDSLEAHRNARTTWRDTLWRIPIGPFVVSSPCVTGLKHTCRWTVLHAVASARVLETWFHEVAPTFSDPKATHPIKHGFAVLIKATVIHEAMECAHEMAERCGAQGTFDTNFIARHKPTGLTWTGVIIAEGDVLVLCIHLWGELASGRYTLPIPATLRRIPGGHISEAAEYALLPESERAIVALGHTCTHSAAKKFGIPQVLPDLYECAAIRDNPCWFAENAGINRAAQRARKGVALRQAAPGVEKHLMDLNIKHAAHSSIITDSTGSPKYSACRSSQATLKVESPASLPATMVRACDLGRKVYPISLSSTMGQKNSYTVIAFGKKRLYNTSYLYATKRTIAWTRGIPAPRWWRSRC